MLKKKINLKLLQQHQNVLMLSKYSAYIWYQYTSNQLICGINVVRDAPGIRMAGYARSETMTNRASHRSISTWVGQRPIYLPDRLPRLYKRPFTCIRFQIDRRCGSTPRTSACSFAYVWSAQIVRCQWWLLATIALVPVYS